MSSRRLHLSTLAAAVLSACTGTSGLGMGLAPRLDPNDPDAALKHKFRGIRGGELCATSMPDYDMGRTYIYKPDNGLFATGGWGTQCSISAYGVGNNTNLPMPKALRLVRYKNSGPLEKSYLYYPSGPVEFEITVPVAERIPEELLADLRRDPKGSLRLKLRVHPDTLLIGWDIERRPGFDPKKRDSYGEAVYVAPGWVKTGGDFKEARGVYWLEDDTGNLIKAPHPDSLGGIIPPELARRGIVFRDGFLREKGWYIHPKTGERIETDF